MAFLINVEYTMVSANPFIGNLPTITSRIIHLSNIPCTIHLSLSHTSAFTLVVKFTIIPVAVFMELLISVYTVKNNYNNYIRLKLMSLQLFSMLVIPLSVLLLIHPQVTFVCTVSLLIIPVGFTLVAAFLLYQCHKRLKRRNFQNILKCFGSTYVFALCCHYRNCWTCRHTACPV